MDLLTAGQTALAHAVETWGRRIVDPPRRTWDDPAYTDSRHAIDTMIRSADYGLGWSRCSPLVKAYRRDGDYEWCGAFAAWCWRKAGLDPVLAEVYWSSTYRLDRYAQGKLAFGSPRELSLRKRLPATGRSYLAFGPDTTFDDIEHFGGDGARAGDILIVNGKGYGQHITIVDRWDPNDGVFHTVEGNATGKGPDGMTYQGVVRQRRKFADCRRLIRPALTDLMGAA